MCEYVQLLSIGKVEDLQIMLNSISLYLTLDNTNNSYGNLTLRSHMKHVYINFDYLVPLINRKKPRFPDHCFHIPEIFASKAFYSKYYL